MREKIRYEKITGMIYDKKVISYLCKVNSKMNYYIVNGRKYYDTVDYKSFDEIENREIVSL